MLSIHHKKDDKISMIAVIIKKFHSSTKLKNIAFSKMNSLIKIFKLLYLSHYWLNNKKMFFLKKICNISFRCYSMSVKHF